MDEVTSEDAAQPKASTTSAPPPIAPERLSLLGALRERDTRIAAIYDAVIHILATRDLPDQLSLAAHAMRELMEHLPLAFDVPVEKKSQVLNMIGDVERDLSRAMDKSSCRSTDGWEGPIDPPLAKVLATVERLVESRKENWASRTEVAVDLMNQLEPSFGRRSRSLVRPEAEAWAGTRRYFERVSHHHHVFIESFDTSFEEFEGRMHAVEILLLDRLRPTTTEDFREIDRLMTVVFDTTND
jgi:hypothetical protein